MKMKHEKCWRNLYIALALAILLICAMCGGGVEIAELLGVVL